MHEFLLRLKALRKRRQLERDLDDELAFHLAMKQEREGVTPADARRAFGNPTSFRERCRDLWTFTSIEALWRDAIYAGRMLRRDPVFTLIAVLSLAIGIGGNTAVFSLTREMLLKSLGVPESQQLRLLTWIGGRDVPVDSISGYGDFDPASQLQSSGSFSYPTFLAFRDRLAPLAQVLAFSDPMVNTSVNGQTDSTQAQMVSGTYFETLGLTPPLGRALTPADDLPNAPPAVVLSHRFWQRRFGSNPAALGTRISINAEPFTVVGVLPAAYTGTRLGQYTEIYYPVAKHPGGADRVPVENNRSWWAQVMLRARPGVTDAQLQPAADLILKQMAQANVEPGQKYDLPRVVIEPGSSGIRYLRSLYVRRLGMLLAVVVLVLLITCANLASLLLARMMARRREIAVRLSIGAGRWQLVRQMFVESLLLACSGGVLGAILAMPLARLAVRFASTARDLDAHPTLDLPVLLFTSGIAIFAALAFGVFPALRATRLDLTPALKDSGPRSGTARLLAGRILVAAQVALSVLLLVGAGLFLRTFSNLSHVQLGFQPERLIVFTVNPSSSGYTGERLRQVYARIREQLRSVPGVSDVAVSAETLIGGGRWTTTVGVPGHVSKTGRDPVVDMLLGSDGFITTMGIPLLRGRDLTPRDNASAPPAAVVNESFVRQFFSGIDPLGRTFQMSKKSWQIVGVCADARYESLHVDATSTVYISYEQREGDVRALSYSVRTAAPPESMMAAIRAAVASVDPDLPLLRLNTQQAQIDNSIGPERFLAAFATAFGFLAAVLAALGLYGVMAYNVARRTSEIGIRLALGADRANVHRLILKESLTVVAAGLALGVPAALALTRLIESSLYEVKPSDPATLVAGAMTMLAIATLAAWLPARRASRVDPVIALRDE